MNPCKITEDLLPLYVEDALSEDSREFVDQHLAECPSCQALHAQMNRVLKVAVTHADAKRSFKSFKQRLLLKKALLITGCSILVFCLLTVCLYKPVEKWLHAELPAPIALVVTTKSELPDGSVLLSLKYAEPKPYLDRFSLTFPRDEPGVLRITPICTRIGQINQFWNNTFYNAQFYNNWIQSFALYTDVDNGTYRISEPTLVSDHTPFEYFEYLSGVYGVITKVVLSGSDGEAVLWEQGDELPPAEEVALNAWESILKDHPFISAPPVTLPPGFVPRTTAQPDSTPRPETTDRPGDAEPSESALPQPDPSSAPH